MTDLITEARETTVHLCYTPMREYGRIHLGERYCFHCRKRRTFTDVIMVSTDPMSYYGPTSKIVCDVCGQQDADVFPGWSRSYEDE